MGCRRPTGGVFTYVSSDTSHAEAFPVATPRGRSSSSHEGETQYAIKQNELIIIIISSTSLSLALVLWQHRCLPKMERAQIRRNEKKNKYWEIKKLNQGGKHIYDGNKSV